MIYSMYWTHYQYNKVAAAAQMYGRLTEAQAKASSVKPQDMLVRLIKEGKGDKFVFITVRTQEESWNKFVKDNELESYVEFEMPYYIVNGNHPGSAPNLKLRILANKE